MSVEVWPPVPPGELLKEIEATRVRELEWLLDELHETLRGLKHGLEDCYALLAPIDPGSTLVLSTHRNEVVKGHITRVGTRIVKGTIHLRLKTMPPITLALNPHHPIHLAPLTALNQLLTHAIDILSLTLSLFSHSPVSSPGATGRNTPVSPSTLTPGFMAAQLRVLAAAIADAQMQLRGSQGVGAIPTTPHPLRTPSPTHLHNPVSIGSGYFAAHPVNPPVAAAPLNLAIPDDVVQHHQQQAPPPLSSLLPAPTPTTPGGTALPPEWTLQSASGAHFRPRLPPGLSFHLSLQDAQLVLALRALEPADAPVAFGTKLALAIGTARRLEHDEADRVFVYRQNADDDEAGGGHPAGGSVVAAAAGRGARQVHLGVGGGQPKAAVRHSRSQGNLRGAAAAGHGARHQHHTGSGHHHGGGPFSIFSLGGSGRQSPVAGGGGAGTPPPPPAGANKQRAAKGTSASDGEDDSSEDEDGRGESSLRQVFVREKVRVESADPSLLALGAKLGALGYTLAQARRNLATVMGEELED